VRLQARINRDLVTGAVRAPEELVRSLGARVEISRARRKVRA
jgi:hypothetical protein